MFAYHVCEWTRSAPSQSFAIGQVVREDVERRVADPAAERLVAGDALLVAGAVEGAHAHVGVRAEHRGELGHVDACAPVDVGRVFTGEEVDAHGSTRSRFGTLRGPCHAAASRLCWDMSAPKVLAIVLAGGEGKRLMPLTAARAKPVSAVWRHLPPRRLRAVATS